MRRGGEIRGEERGYRQKGDEKRERTTKEERTKKVDEIGREDERQGQERRFEKRG